MLVDGSGKAGVIRTDSGGPAHFLCVAGGKSGANAILKLASQRRDVRVVESGVSAWNGHKSANWDDVETLYRIGES